MKNRYIAQKIQKSPKSILLLGPRQTGKTTLMSTLNPDLSINLADEAEYQAFLINHDEIKERIEILHHSKEKLLIFIDEIQRHPQLLNTIQSILDNSKSKYKFLLTGSSARKLKRGAANLYVLRWGKCKIF